MKKIYVLDTSVYLTSANAIYAFKSSDIAIPIKVLEEIDKHKKRQDIIGSNARQTIRILDSLREKGSLQDGIRLAKGKGIVRIVNSRLANLPVDLNDEIADNKIIACALRIAQDEPGKKVILVSRDINMRVIANSLNLLSEDFSSEHVIKDSSKLFSGISEYVLDEKRVQDFYEHKLVLTDEELVNFYPNEFVRLKTPNSDKIDIRKN